ncbi:MAG TPA: lipase maturation factor family protein [Candidatus Acidoferrales bacterium]|nr:lipase maturation factor family protein [Candidatus Acidoferrales bacterium]
MESYFDGLWLVRLLFQRGLAAIYLIAFVVALNQFPALLGEKGLLPVRDFLRRVSFQEAPSLFHWHYSDRLLAVVSWLGILLSTLALLGLPELGPFWVSAAAWLALWGLNLSIVNVGQRFYAFGWESMLLEAGFFAAFLGPQYMEPSPIPILILRWMLFRVELGAGLIKLRHDRCWWDLTCLFYHYETQPLPNPLSWYFHRLPKVFHKLSVLVSHFVQIIAPFGLFAPQPLAALAAALIILHQCWLIISGNYSWLNWLTVVLGVVGLSDGVLALVLPLAVPELMPLPASHERLLFVLAGATAVLSVQPIFNLFSRDQLMNFSFNPLHLVNAYGAFGSITKERYEIVVEGTDATAITSRTVWKAYEFKAKPGDPMRRPPQVAPYHLRLDWLMWFLPFSVAVTPGGLYVPGHESWFRRFVQKLLEGDRRTIRLLSHNPFPAAPPKYVRARFYLYQYTDWRERKQTGAWWKRTLVGEYLEPVSAADFEIDDTLRRGARLEAP